MVTKSLPAFMHKSIGAKTHKAGAASKHMSYIMREDAMTMFQAANMPDGRGTRTFFDKLWEKAGSPENARIADQFIIALPLELDAGQRHEAVQSFMQSLGKGRIAWCAAHHDKDKDSHNPHVHILFKDADIDTGRKVIGTTTNSRDVREAEEHGWRVPPRTTTRQMRDAWCNHLNRCMEREGIEVRYDARTLKERGIDRDPGIHIGPKAQALYEKGHDFKSRDLTRHEQMGSQTIPYSRLDDGSRIEHNRKIMEANRSRDAVNDGRDVSGAAHKPGEGTEKQTLRETQAQARRDLYREQQRDRDALRAAQDKARLEHEKWAKQLYAKARETAYRSVKERYAEKWETTRAIEDLKERGKAAAALKLEQKKSYERESTIEVDKCRPAKDEAWKAMRTAQDKERLDLRNLHRQETAALARQHIAERSGVHEKWRARSLEAQAGRIDARLTMRQGMAAQQRAALDTVKLHARGQRGNANGQDAASANPREAARGYFESARAEQAKHEAIRDKLLETRRQNLERAGLSPDSSLGPSSQRELAGSSMTHGGATGKGSSPRETLAPGIQAARESRGGRIQDRARDVDPQIQIRQAVASGRPLTDSDRANASPEIREQISRDERVLQDDETHYTY